MTRLEDIRSQLESEVGDEHERLGLLSELEEYVGRAATAAILARIIENIQEVDQVRIEALKIVSARDLLSHDENETVGRAIARVIERDDYEDDPLVREWAARSGWKVAKTDYLFSMLSKTIGNEDEDENVRYNCLHTIMLAGPTPDSIALLKSLRDREGIGAAAERALQRWHTE